MMRTVEADFGSTEVRTERQPERRPLRRTLATIAATLSILVSATVPSHAVFAECGFPNHWPSFAKIAPHAESVLVGTVGRITSRKRHHPGTFIVRVDTVLKGSADRQVTLADVWTDGGCVVSWLDVRRGDRIAVALGGDSNVNGPVSAVAFLSPMPRYSNMHWAGMRRLTMAQVRQAVGLPATDMVSAPPDGGRMSQLEPAAFVGLVRAAVEFAAQFVDRLRASR